MTCANSNGGQFASTVRTQVQGEKSCARQRRKELPVSAIENKRNHSNTTTFLLIIILLLISMQNVTSQSAVKKTGTFSSMEYNKEGGDLLGEEIRIVHTNSGSQGVIQFSGGEPTQLILVSINFHGDSLFFEIPSGEYKGLFRGKVNRNILEGSLKMDGEKEKKIHLKRKRSYWD